MSVIEDTVLFMIRRKGIEEEQMVMKDSVSRLLKKIQQKDQYTEEHCNRTGNLAMDIAVHMQLAEDVIENVLYTGKLYDVGKIDISAHILNKHGRLTVDEFDNIKKHPQAGHNIVMREMASEHYAKIVLEHHEKLDGSGYPKGLKGDDICIEAKVILVADSFDAMTSDRPYHEARTAEEAIAELRSYAGIWYDADIVEALAETVQKRKEFEK
jgi:HD-GYP domain-containing protein (c-di-GMP phosphodiesterase class II)